MPLRLKTGSTVLSIVGLLVLLVLAGGTQDAFADLRVCNQTQNPVSVAIGYRAERAWQSEGWWVAGPGACAVVHPGELNTRFYYMHAVDDVGGGSWDGPVFMCTRDESFTIAGVEDCLARGYERTGFAEIDTQNKSVWTVQLTDNNQTSQDFQ